MTIQFAQKLHYPLTFVACVCFCVRVSCVCFRVFMLLSEFFDEWRWLLFFPVSEILQVFCWKQLPHSYFIRILGMFPWTRLSILGLRAWSEDPKLINRVITFEVTQLYDHGTSTSQTDRQTDRQTGWWNLREWTKRHGKKWGCGKYRSGQCGTMWQGWTMQEWTYRHDVATVDNAGEEKRIQVSLT